MVEDKLNCLVGARREGLFLAREVHAQEQAIGGVNSGTHGSSGMKQYHSNNNSAPPFAL